MKIILASTSKYRKRILERTGLRFECRSPRVAEELIVGEALSCIVRRAEAKAVYCPQNEGEIIIASDQGLVFEGELIGKAGTREKAFEQLSRFSGKSAQLFTAVCVKYGEKLLQASDSCHLCFRHLSPSVIRHTLRTDNPVDCAGSFKIESSGALLFEKIESEDPTTIEGLPLMKTLALLERIAPVENFLMPGGSDDL